MKVYETSDIRNVALVGHGNSGKTALTSALLFSAGATPRVENITDFDEEEIARKITISSAVAAAEWKGKKINLIDTPGFNIFINDTRGTLVAADAALVVVDGIAGVEVQTEKVWTFTDEFVLPRAIVINKLDRERSSFERTLENVQAAFGRTAIPIHWPIGAEKDFKGIVDLVRMKSYVGGKEGDIPADLADSAKAAHEALVEMVAEGNDALLEEFFNEGTLPVDHILDGLREAVRVRRIAPVLCASATANIGGDLILSFINEHFPSPLECGSWKGKANGKEVERAIKDSGPVSAFVFKTVADAFAGRVSYFKVISGVLKNDAHLVNSRSSVDERLAHIGALFGKTIVPLNELHADKTAMIEYPEVRLPEPSIAYAIAAKTRNDEDRMGNAIHKILEEDRSLRFYRDPQTKEFLLAGCGQQHIEIIVSRLKKRYGVEVALHAPKIPYRETIRGRAEVQGRHKKQTGGHGQFGDCWIRMEPLARGGKFEFANEVFGGAIPKNFIPAIEKGILETAERGYLAGFPVVDFKVVVYDGSYHDVDSSEMSFKLAARKAFRAGMEAAKPSLLEPIMNVEVQAPVEFAGDLMGDMNSRRGRISGMDTKGGTQIIKAQVPMAEMLDYLNVLTSMTQGRGSFAMEFDHYDFVPGLQAEKIIAAAKAARAGEEEEEE
jgi:elongation factor G